LESKYAVVIYNGTLGVDHSGDISFAEQDLHTDPLRKDIYNKII